ncbi:hypothetical protein SGLAM104S_00977 [Streptomyces glaucescens]
MEGSDLVAETLGERVFDFFLRNKRQEWEEYRSEVNLATATLRAALRIAGAAAPDDAALSGWR